VRDGKWEFVRVKIVGYDYQNPMFVVSRRAV